MSQNPYFPVNADLGAIQTFAAQATAGHTNDFQSNGAKGVKIVINISAVGSSPSLVVKIKNKDNASNTYQDVLDTAAILGTGQTVLTVFPGATAATNVAANDHLTALWRIEWTLSGGTVTGTVGANLLT